MDWQLVEKLTLAALLVSISAAYAGASQPPGFPQCEVQRINGVLRIVVGGKPITGLAYLTALGGLEHQDEAYDAGIRLFRLPLGLCNSKEGSLDTAQIDRSYSEFIARHPDAYILPHLEISAPKWWLEKNPDEVWRHASENTAGNSPASAKWRKEIGEDLRRYIEHIGQAPYADRIIGFVLAAGETTEWMAWGLMTDEKGDFSPANLSSYRKWLHSNITRDVLESALGAGVTAGSATVPALADQKPNSFDIINPSAAAALYYQYNSYPAAESIKHFARIVKQASGGRLLAGCYYGYTCQLGGYLPESQHLAVQRLADCPDIDFLGSPPVYTNRGPGGTSTFMSCTASILARDKLWFDEADNRTHLTPADTSMGPVGRAETKQETLAVMKREFGHVISRGALEWCFDMSGGWFSDPDILKLLGGFEQYRAQIFDDPDAPPFVSEVAFLVDELNLCFLTPNLAGLGNSANTPSFLDAGFASFFSLLPTLGAPYDVYLMCDAHRLPESVKLVVVMNAYRLEQSQLDVLRQLGRPGRSVLWVYAPGLYEAEPGVLGSRNSERMRSLTSIQLEVDDSVSALSASAQLPDRSEAAFSAGSGRPLIWCSDSTVESIATYVGTDRCALAIKDRGGWYSMWSGVPNVAIPVLRELARKAGVHIYSETGDTFYAGYGTITIHSNHAGRKAVNLGTTLDAEEVFAEAPRKWSQASRLEFDLGGKDTIVLRLSRPAVSDASPGSMRNE